jgi:hypothetical protein
MFGIFYQCFARKIHPPKAKTADLQAFRELARSLQTSWHRQTVADGFQTSALVRETIMFSFDTSDLQRFAVSTIGALILSTACIVAAAGPVRAAEPTPQATVPVAAQTNA